jgi:ubiquinone/menaquinone biosynthesis C-methylase UbiE
MQSESVAAYDLPERVARYDTDMNLMHPNRPKMIDVAMEVISTVIGGPTVAIDLGIGTGFFTDRLLQRFPSARVIAIDGAAAMMDLARARLGDRTERVQFVVGDFRSLETLLRDVGPVDAVVSSYALHHLNAAEKLELFRKSHELLRPGGILVNADILVSESEAAEKWVQQIRVGGIVRRASGRDPRFPDAAAVRVFLDELEASDADQPLTLRQDVDLVCEAGFREVDVFWKEYREAVFGGVR